MVRLLVVVAALYGLMVHAIVLLRMEMKMSNLFIMLITIPLFLMVVRIQVMLAPVVVVLSADPTSDFVFRMGHLFDVVLYRVVLLVLDAVLDAQIGDLLRRQLSLLILVVNCRGDLHRMLLRLLMVGLSCCVRSFWCNMVLRFILRAMRYGHLGNWMTVVDFSLCSCGMMLLLFLDNNWLSRGTLSVIVFLLSNVTLGINC